jgi:hypothetical protein
VEAAPQKPFNASYALLLRGTVAVDRAKAMKKRWARTEEGSSCHFGSVHLTNIWNSRPVGA